MPYCFFLKGLTHDFGQKVKILPLLVFGQNGPGDNVLMIIEVKKQALLDYKRWILHTCLRGIFSKGLTHDFGHKIKILSLFVSGQNWPGMNVS